eukprot:6742792-Alexandrium_andersonii.AAC.1
MSASLVGSEMCIRDSCFGVLAAGGGSPDSAAATAAVRAPECPEQHQLRPWGHGRLAQAFALRLEQCSASGSGECGLQL